MATAFQFPERQPALDAALASLLNALDELADVALPLMTDMRFSAVAGRLSFQTLMETGNLFRQELAGKSAGWNTPFAGRLLLELGGFWGWAQDAALNGAHPGDAMRAFGHTTVAEIDKGLRNAGLGVTSIDRFLGPAVAFRDVTASSGTVPIPKRVSEMLLLGYNDFGRVANRLYRLLSQFTHGTGLGVMHLEEDGNFGTISEPMRAVAAAGLALGADALTQFPIVLGIGLDEALHVEVRRFRNNVRSASVHVLRIVEALTGIIV